MAAVDTAPDTGEMPAQLELMRQLRSRLDSLEGRVETGLGARVDRADLAREVESSLFENPEQLRQATIDINEAIAERIEQETGMTSEQFLNEFEQKIGTDDFLPWLARWENLNGLDRMFNISTSGSGEAQEFFRQQIITQLGEDPDVLLERYTASGEELPPLIREWREMKIRIRETGSFSHWDRIRNVVTEAIGTLPPDGSNIPEDTWSAIRENFLNSENLTGGAKFVFLHWVLTRVATSGAPPPGHIAGAIAVGSNEVTRVLAVTAAPLLLTGAGVAKFLDPEEDATLGRATAGAALAVPLVASYIGAVRGILGVATGDYAPLNDIGDAYQHMVDGNEGEALSVLWRSAGYLAGGRARGDELRRAIRANPEFLTLLPETIRENLELSVPEGMPDSPDAAGTARTYNLLDVAQIIQRVRDGEALPTEITPHQVERSAKFVVQILDHVMGPEEYAELQQGLSRHDLEPQDSVPPRVMRLLQRAYANALAGDMVQFFLNTTDDPLRESFFDQISQQIIAREAGELPAIEERDFDRIYEGRVDAEQLRAHPQRFYSFMENMNGTKIAITGMALMTSFVWITYGFRKLFRGVRSGMTGAMDRISGRHRRGELASDTLREGNARSVREHLERIARMTPEERARRNAVEWNDVEEFVEYMQRYRIFGGTPGSGEASRYQGRFLRALRRAGKTPLQIMEAFATPEFISTLTGSREGIFNAFQSRLSDLLGSEMTRSIRVNGEDTTLENMTAAEQRNMLVRAKMNSMRALFLESSETRLTSQITLLPRDDGTMHDPNPLELTKMRKKSSDDSYIEFKAEYNIPHRSGETATGTFRLTEKADGSVVLTQDRRLLGTRLVRGEWGVESIPSVQSAG